MCASFFGWPCRTFSVNSFPENRTFTTFDYATGPCTAQLTWRWIDNMLNAAPKASADFGFPNRDLAIPDVPNTHYFDLALCWQVTPSLDLRFVASNLFDEQPPNLADP